MIRGLVLGKFLPPHAGHLHLIEVARALCDRLTVVVGTLASEPIDGALRHMWMTELCGPAVDVVHLADENPQDPSETPDFWNIWDASLRRVLPALPDRVFASEPYGARLAELFAARFIPVDLARAAVPITATAIREDPETHWRHLPRLVRPYFARRVSVFGPESTGKSTLAARLANAHGATLVPEIARAILEARGEPLEADMPLIARAQAAFEDAAARGDRPLLICDTDPLATSIWSEFLFGRIAPEVAALGDRDYDLTLLCDVDVPFVADPVRYLPDQRRAFFDRCRDELERRGRRTAIIGGDWDSRFALASAAIDTARTSWRRRRGTS
jgi:NadR type nicotinamide-nucleotide adenylyltransferase